jgi:DNA topoisomerase-1
LFSPKATKLPPTLAGGDDSSDSDVPLAAARMSKEKAKIMKEAEKISKKLQAEEKKQMAKKPRATVKKEETESDSDAPIKARKRSAPVNNKTKKEESSDDDEPLVKKSRSINVKRETKNKGRVNESETPATTGSPNEADEDEEEETYKWWENQAETDGTQKWTALEHNGVMFPPPYDPLPKNIKMKYNGVLITLPIEAEEVAGFFGAMIDSSHARNPKFVENFFGDFQEVLKEHGGARNPEGKKIAVNVFEKCDFTPMFEYFEERRAEKKALSLAEKKVLKQEKEEAEKKYTFCILDGRKEKVGNFRIEPPGLFRGRGDHPKTGKVKQRVQPEQVTINIGKGAVVPLPPQGHKWGGIQHDDKVTWLATWKENINGNIKYVMLAATSSLKGQSDFKKFEKARELKVYVLAPYV